MATGTWTVGKNDFYFNINYKKKKEITPLIPEYKLNCKEQATHVSIHQQFHLSKTFYRTI